MECFVFFPFLDLCTFPVPCAFPVGMAHPPVGVGQLPDCMPVGAGPPPHAPQTPVLVGLAQYGLSPDGAAVGKDMSVPEGFPDHFGKAEL